MKVSCKYLGKETLYVVEVRDDVEVFDSLKDLLHYLENQKQRINEIIEQLRGGHNGGSA